MKKPRVTTIVLTWNSADFIRECLDSLLVSDFKTDILVVDNNSADDTRDVVIKNYPTITLVNTGENLGYAGGNNFGINIAKQAKPDYIFILNPDAQVAPNCIGELVRGLERDKNLAASSPLIYFHNTIDKVWYGGASMKWRTGERIQLPTIDKGQFANIQNTDFLSGCAMLLRVKAIDAVGLMDERYFLYCEETDWSLRFMNFGYKIGLQPTAKAWHIASASTGGFASPLYQYYINRNRLLLIQKHRKLLLPIVAFSSIYMNAFRLIAIAKDKGLRHAFVCARAILKAYFDFVFRRFGGRYP